MKKTLFLAVVAALIGGCGDGPSNAERPSVTPSGAIQYSKGSKAFSVNSEAVPQPLLDAYAKRRGYDLNDPGQLQQSIDELGNLVALAQDGTKRGLDRTPEAELERLNALSGMVMREQQEANPIPETELKARYDAQVVASGGKEYRVEHLLFKSEELAATAISGLQEGKSYADLRNSYQGNADFVTTPDWNFVQLTQLPPVIADVLRPMADGEIAKTPIKSDFGFHVVRVVETRPFEPQPFDTVKQGIREQIEQERRLAFVESIKASTKIEK